MTASAPATAKGRSAIAPLGAAAAAFYALFIVRSAFPADGAIGFTLFDDAMISMRYARNLAEGHGLVWNPGERVEGITNPLWTLWMSIVHAAGVSDEHASFVVMVSGALLLLATAVIAARVAREIFESAEVAAASFALVAFNYALSFWTLRGMEVGLLAFLVTFAIGQTLTVERGNASPVWLSVTLALADVTRRDAAIVHVAVMAYLAWATNGRRRIVVLSALAASLGLAMGAQLLFSAWYYGDPWPNTYYLKLGGVTLSDRLRRGVPALGIVVVRNLLPLVIAAMFLWRRESWASIRRPVILLSGLVAIQAAYSAYVGGDAWEYMGYTNRYLTTVVPVLSILAAAGLDALASSTAARRGRFAALIIGTLAIRLVLEAVLHVANRGVARGELWFDQHRTLWIAALTLGALALTVIAIAIDVRSRRQVSSAGSWTRHRYALACLAVWLVANGVAIGEWTAWNASSMSNDVRGAQTGLAVRRLTSADTLIAVTSAGNVPYFSRRRAIDILGKSDPVIAHMRPINVFVPGHNKWNLDHSIRDGGPDLVWGLPRMPGEAQYLSRLGYQSYPGMCFARRSSDRFDHAGLWHELAALYPDAPPLTEGADAARVQ